MKNKEIVKTGFEKYLNEFDEKYRTRYHEKQDVIPMLLKLFKQYDEEINTLSALDKEMHKLQTKISNKLQEKLNKKENELLEQLKYGIYAETEEQIEKAFIYGFCVAQSLKEESESFIKG